MVQVRFFLKDNEFQGGPFKMEKTTRTNTCSTNKQQAIKNLKAVELVPVATEPQLSSFIQVQIGNCNIEQYTK